MEYKNISKTVYKINDFLSWQKNDSLILSPNFQRRDVWPLAAKSFLIDTVVRGLPIPIIFIRERTDLKTLEPQREVVDGQQRLRTVIAYISPELLKDFNSDKDKFVVKKTHYAEIADKTFQELDPKIRRQILSYEFSVHVLPSDTEDREVLQIFARMNSTGVKLNRQELRNAEYFGSFKQLTYNLAYEQINRWRDWNIFTENDIARMIEVEETSDTIQLMLVGLHSKSQPALDKLYDTYEDNFTYEAEVSHRFRGVMDKIDDTLGNQLKSLAFSRKALFNTLFTFYYDLMFGLKSKLEKKKSNILPPKVTEAVKKASEAIRHKKLPDDLSRVLRGATANLESRKIRLEFLQNIYKNA